MSGPKSPAMGLLPPPPEGAAEGRLIPYGFSFSFLTLARPAVRPASEGNWRSPSSKALTESLYLLRA
eukprot:scaffold10619_cov41-Attheya_sp.AAC.6